MKGFKGRALELPDGTEVAVSPDDRARIRYSHLRLGGLRSRWVVLGWGGASRRRWSSLPPLLSLSA
jgi:hypothetical protein